jgi:hypothetical protein
MTVTGLWPGAVAMTGGGPNNPPDWCFEPDADGFLPECTYIGGEWVATDDGGLGGGVGPGFDSTSGVMGGFGVFFVLVLLLAIGGAVWRVTTARRLARNAGMDEGDATAMTLLTDNGLESTYLAANLRPPAAPAPAPAAAPAEPPRSSADRLRELQDLLTAGLVTQEEYDARRRAILDSL